jgi:hypothetical protein
MDAAEAFGTWMLPWSMCRSVPVLQPHPNPSHGPRPTGVQACRLSILTGVIDMVSFLTWPQLLGLLWCISSASLR